MLRFYGFTVDIDKVQQGPMFRQKSRNWLSPSNHNYLRITRIPEAMMMFGFERTAKTFCEELHQVYRENGTVIGDRTLGFWRRACV